MAVLRFVAHSSSSTTSRDGDAQWAAYAGGVVSVDEAFLMRMELQATLRTLDDRQWALITHNMLGEDDTLVSQSSLNKVSYINPITR